MWVVGGAKPCGDQPRLGDRHSRIGFPPHPAPRRPCMTGNPTWAERSVLVTGATGMVGSALTQALVALGPRVTALVADHDPQSELIRSGTIDRVTVVNGRLEDVDAIARAITGNEVDTVFHLGAQPIVSAG